MTEHITPTEMALYYEGGLNVGDTERVDAHLSECVQCSECYQLVKGPLDELHAGELERVSARGALKRLDSVIGPADERKPDAEDRRKARSSQMWPLLLEFPQGSTAYAAYATATPGPTAAGKVKAAVYDKQDNLKEQVPADLHIKVAKDGGLLALVTVHGPASEYDGKEVRVELSNELDWIPTACSILRKTGERVLEATCVRKPDPDGGLSPAQLKSLTARIVVFG